jgi:hypothetical protein
MEPRQVESQESRVESQQDAEKQKLVGRAPSVLQLAAILLLAVYLMNVCYVFDGSSTSLKNFQFVSTALTGLDKPGERGNRFAGTWFGEIPVPLPEQYVLGFDSQKKDLEHFPQKSYLRGQWKEEGWYYYYVYGLLVKVPCGTWGLFALVITIRLAASFRPSAPDAMDRQSRERSGRDSPGTNSGGPQLIPDVCFPPIRDEVIVLVPAVTLLAIVSSQTEFNIHLRYVFPSLGLLLIFLGSAGPIVYTSWSSLQAVPATGLIAYSVCSGLLVYPHQLTYFNDFIGGPRNGHNHLLGSSFDWGQNTLLIHGALTADVPLRNIPFVTNDVNVISLLRHLGYTKFNPPQNGPFLLSVDYLICISADPLSYSQNIRSLSTFTPDKYASVYNTYLYIENSPVIHEFIILQPGKSAHLSERTIHNLNAGKP